MNTTSKESKPDTNTSAQLALAGGCFWCLEGIFAALRGVSHAESGYSNGLAPPISYEEVCTGNTGCAEVVRVTYAPSIISTAQLLQVFFSIHDPSTLNRQGADVGTQYRSGIYYTQPEQAHDAAEMIAQLRAQGWRIVTEVAPLQHYCAAENYHQNYLQENPKQPYCQMVALPKFLHAKKQFEEWFKPF